MNGVALNLSVASAAGSMLRCGMAQRSALSFVRTRFGPICRTAVASPWWLASNGGSRLGRGWQAHSSLISTADQALLAMTWCMQLSALSKSARANCTMMVPPRGARARPPPCCSGLRERTQSVLGRRLENCTDGLFQPRLTKLSSTRFSPALSKSMVSLLPSTERTWP